MDEKNVEFVEDSLWDMLESGGKLWNLKGNQTLCSFVCKNPIVTNFVTCCLVNNVFFFPSPVDRFAVGTHFLKIFCR